MVNLNTWDKKYWECKFCVNNKNRKKYNTKLITKSDIYYLNYKPDKLFKIRYLPFHKKHVDIDYGIMKKNVSKCQYCKKNVNNKLIHGGYPICEDCYSLTYVNLSLLYIDTNPGQQFCVGLGGLQGIGFLLTLS